MLAWILYGFAGVIAGGAYLSLWRRQLEGYGLIALGNIGFMVHRIMVDSPGFAVAHLALAVGALILWAALALWESA